MNKQKNISKEILEILKKLNNISIYINEYGFNENYDVNIKEQIGNLDNMLETIEKNIDYEK